MLLDIVGQGCDQATLVTRVHTGAPACSALTQMISCVPVPTRNLKITRQLNEHYNAIFYLPPQDLTLN